MVNFKADIKKNNKNKFFSVSFALKVTIAAILFILLILVIFFLFSKIYSKNNYIYYNQFYDFLNQARSTAISQGVNVKICPSDDGLECKKVEVPGDWNSKLLMFISDKNFSYEESFTNLDKPNNDSYIIVDHVSNIEFQPTGFTFSSTVIRHCHIVNSIKSHTDREIRVDSSGNITLVTFDHFKPC